MTTHNQQFLEHSLGENIHILSHPFSETVLTKFSSVGTFQPTLNHQIQLLYQFLFTEAFNFSFNVKENESDTRMKELVDEAVLKNTIVDGKQKAVFVDLARAGTYPSHIGYELCHFLLEQQNIRQDHFYLNRKVNENEEVIGVDVSGSKIGGGQGDAVVFFPDPMGATGGSLSYCVDHYKNKVEGKAKRYVALHLIITPEYVRRMKKDHPDVEIFALRYDRGLSKPEVLQTLPGERLAEESGLTEKQYIVPGAGGVGEILNNSFV
ncbi:uracil phosphoribosyltransferase [Bacteriovoracaceae bacterium]|nr:uracil phosphoribosyltransferase [Bacteriovoracaceae bacterium]